MTCHRVAGLGKPTRKINGHGGIAIGIRRIAVDRAHKGRGVQAIELVGICRLGRDAKVGGIVVVPQRSVSRIVVMPSERKAGRIDTVQQVRVGHFAHRSREVDNHLPGSRADHCEDVELLLIGPEARHALLKVDSWECRTA
ncbi:MAG: hypothetical protein EB069_06475 [Actinobacteria bacterium]|nr:hypothetical protein [Actinomycetota bacterium]